MKTHFSYIIGAGAMLAVALSGCSKNFFNRPPENQATVGTYYQTTAEVQSSTDILYAAPWFGLNGKALLAIGDLQSGNAVCYAGTDGEFDAFANLSEGNATLAVQSAWNSLYTVIAQANALLNNLPSAASSVPTAVVNNALGEARLMRAAAYFYLVRNFGNVPIITNPTADVNDFDSVHANYVTDVYQFITQDLLFAQANCTPGVAGTGHVSSGSATGLLAKVYLYEQKYDSAQLEAAKVINSGEFSLVGTTTSAALQYTNMFELAGNNCSESMIALQWTSVGGYGFGNQIQSVIADGENGNYLTGTGDGYGELGPSWDLQDAYTAEGDTGTYISGVKLSRRHGTMQMGGDVYPELHKSTGGYTTPYTVDCQGMHSALKKYVVGTPADNGGLSAAQATSNNTYILRYADVLLIYAEATLGLSSGVAAGTGIPFTAVSTDATSIGYINMIRARAGITPLTGSFTYQQLFTERRLELAGEGEFWYDLQRLDGFNVAHHPTAISVISQQNRGMSTGDGTAPYYTTGWSRNTLYVTPVDANFLLPPPATESAADPALLATPVHYQF